MFRSTIIFVGLVVGCLKFSNAQDNGSTLYSRRYERLDIDTILASPRLVTNYVECLLNKKPCPPEGKALKRILPEALRTKCGRCWPSQKEGALKVITALYNDYPQHYKDLRARWDPTGEYHRRFMEYLRDQKFNVINSNGDGELDGDQSRISVSSTTQTIQTSTQRTTRPQSSRPSQTSQTPATILARVPTEPTTPRRIPQDQVTEPSQDQVPNFIGNRFADTAEEFEDSRTMRTQAVRTPAPTPKPTMPITTKRPAIIGTSTYFQTQNPILDFINRLTMKFANTAELIASMVRTKLGRN